MNIVLLGNNQAAILAAQAIRCRPSYRLRVVVPAKKKVHSWHDSLYDYAVKAGVCVYCYNNINQSSFIDDMQDFCPDLFLSIYYDQILSSKLLSIPRLASINVHPSLLPKYRGNAPIIWAIVNGETETGVSFHHMVPGVDRGAIVMQQTVAINANDTAYEVHQKCNELVAEMLPVFFRRLENRDLLGTKQLGASSFYQKSDANLNCIDWQRDSAQRIHNIIRALSKPLPGAYSYFRQQRWYLWRSNLLDSFKFSGPIKPGGLLSDQAGRLLVATKAEVLQILELGTSAKHVISATEFIQQFCPLTNESFVSSV